MLQTLHVHKFLGVVIIQLYAKNFLLSQIILRVS